MQFAIADASGFGRVVTLPDDGGLVAATIEVAVDAVGRDIQFAVVEPTDAEVLDVEGDILDPGRGADPVDALGDLGPEDLGLLDRALIAAQILLGADRGGGAEGGRGVVDGGVILLAHGLCLPAARGRAFLLMMPHMLAPGAVSGQVDIGRIRHWSNPRPISTKGEWRGRAQCTQTRHSRNPGVMAPLWRERSCTDCSTRRADRA